MDLHHQKQHAHKSILLRVLWKKHFSSQLCSPSPGAVAFCLATEVAFAHPDSACPAPAAPWHGNTFPQLRHTKEQFPLRVQCKKSAHTPGFCSQTVLNNYSPAGTQEHCCTGLSPCCCCFLPFLAPSAPCSHIPTLVLALPSTRHLHELLQPSNPAEKKLSGELCPTLTRLSWLTGTTTQGEGAEPPLPVVNSSSPPGETSITNQS